MNVTAGCLAIVVGKCGLTGKIVKVEKYLGMFPYQRPDLGPSWGCILPRPVITKIATRHGPSFEPIVYVALPDSFLRKISPPEGELIPDPIEAPNKEPA